MKQADLHLHTTFSDGICEPKQVIKEIALGGIKVASITDHDHTGGYNEAKKTGEEWGVEVITGVEISTPQYHILGYDFNVEDKKLQKLLKVSRDIQTEIVKRRLEDLIEQGIPITLEKIQSYHPESRIGKMNIIYSVLRDPECREIVGKMSVRDFYKNHMKHTKFIIEQEISPEEAITTIRNAGGRAILAHPFKDVKNMSEIDKLIGLGLEGIEIQPNFKDKNYPYLRFAKERGIIITKGSDYHGAVYGNRPLLIGKENRVKKFWKWNNHPIITTSILPF